VETNEATVTPQPPTGGFDVAFRGLTVEVVLHPLVAPAEPPTIDAIVDALDHTPLDRINRGPITRALGDLAEATDDIRVPVGSIQVPHGIVEPCTIIASRDGRAAYAVPTAPPTPPRRPPAPPDGSATAADAPADAPQDAPDDSTPTPAATDGADAPGTAADEEDREDAASNRVSAALLRQQMTSAHIVVGARDEVIDAFGDGKPLADTVCVAWGQDPVPGQDAELAYHFDPHPRLIPQQLDDGSIDYHTLLVERFVEAGTVLVTRTPAVQGTPGRTVQGSRIDVPSVRTIDLHDLAGQNTVIEGEDLIAVDGGRPVQATTGKIEVLPVFEVAGDQDYGVGNIDFPGDVIVRGDVRPGFSIRAGGAVVVRGFVEGATITSKHDLAVSGVVGEQPSRFDVGGDLAAGYLHTTIAEVAGTATVRREIVNCTLNANRVATSSTGRIVGGVVTAETEIDAGVIGAANGLLTEVSVLSRASTAVIRARRAAHPGAVVHVGGVRRQIEDLIEAPSFWDVEGTIVSLPAGADESDVRKLRESGSTAA
jgi:hypothetical protein